MDNLPNNAPKDCPTQVCKKCKQEKPNTNAYFVVDVNDQSKMTTLCKKCAKKIKQQEKAKIQKHTENLIVRLEQFSVDLIAKEAVSDPNNLPHSAELVESIMRAFGGVDNFGKIYAMHYWQAEPGKAQRTRMLQAMAALVVQNVDQGGAKKPVELWTIEELQDEYNRQVELAASRRQPLRIAGAVADAG